MNGVIEHQYVTRVVHVKRKTEEETQSDELKYLHGY